MTEKLLTAEQLGAGLDEWREQYEQIVGEELEQDAADEVLRHLIAMRAKCVWWETQRKAGGVKESHPAMNALAAAFFEK
eukprot:gene11584-13685_t